MLELESQDHERGFASILELLAFLEQ